MTINKSYNLLFKGWFKIKGRSSRQEYILRFSIMWLALFLSNIASELTDSIEENIIMLIFCTFLLFVCILFLFLSTAQVFFVTNRRLHDLNSSGWWQLVTFIPFGQILMIGFIFFKGTPGPNKYGNPPTY